MSENAGSRIERTKNRMKAQDRIANAAPRAKPFQEILGERLSRRQALLGGLGLAAGTLFAGAGVAACGGGGSDTDTDGGSDDGGDPGPTTSLNFESIPGQDTIDTTVADGYRQQVLIPWGTGILGSYPSFDASGATSHSGADQAEMIGTNHDGMYYFPIDGSSSHGLLVVNHEYTNSELFGSAGRTEDVNGAPTVADEVRKDINAHGVSVVEVIRNGSGEWIPVNTGMNRRITGSTPMDFSGPVAGTALLVTPYDNTGRSTRGTINNCGNGTTPWGTYLTCEENFQGYLYNTVGGAIPPEQDRYGISDGGFGYLWANVAGDASEVNREFERWDVNPTGAGPTDDYRNEVNCFGWMVEVDPQDPSSTPKKRTAMGRFRHEGSAHSPAQDGRKLAFYMGDDARFEYLYKFVTRDAYNASSPDPDMLDNGTLYAAQFNADGTGTWLPLDYATQAALQADAFLSNQAQVLCFARMAADILGATPMDRPEWTTVDPVTGELYFTCTNNTRRDMPGEENPPNPRLNNAHGHIIRIKEDADAPDATTFAWDIFAFGSNATADPAYNISGLDLDNELGSPDGIWMDPRGLLWIQTDNGAPLDSNSNDQVLCVIPSELPDNRLVRPATQKQMRRFFVGPRGCEVTGIAMTPDYRTIFFNIQHPDATWPDGPGTLARSATIAISREDGGTIGIDG